MSVPCGADEAAGFQRWRADQVQSFWFRKERPVVSKAPPRASEEGSQGDHRLSVHFPCEHASEHQAGQAKMSRNLADPHDRRPSDYRCGHVPSPLLGATDYPLRLKKKALKSRKFVMSLRLPWTLKKIAQQNSRCQESGKSARFSRITKCSLLHISSFGPALSCTVTPGTGLNTLVCSFASQDGEGAFVFN